MVEAALKTLLLLVLAVLATAYTRGWRRLSVVGHARPVWRTAAYALGLLTVAGALLSPLDDLAVSRFSAHMAQHLLLTMMAAPLLLLGNPLSLVLWGVPPGLRHRLAMPLRRDALPRSARRSACCWRSRSARAILTTRGSRRPSASAPSTIRCSAAGSCGAARTCTCCRSS